MLEYYDGGNSFILHFNMKHMDSRDVARSSAIGLYKAQDWWDPSAVAVQSMREHVTQCTPNGESFRFEKELAGLDSDTIEAVEKFIKILGFYEL